MKTAWEWSLELEAKRLAHIARNISTGFYDLNGFVVLPPKYLKQNSEIVVFPDIDIKSISNFWNRVKKVDTKDWTKFEDKDLLEKIVDLLIVNRISEPNVSKLKRIWERAEKAVIKEIERVLNLTAPISSVSIYPSNFGPGGSFNVHNKSPYKIELFIRFDKSIHTIAEGIISSLIQNDLLNTLGANFVEKEIMIDWLVNNSSINKVIDIYESKDKFVPTSKIISKKQRSELHIASKDFLRKLRVTDFSNLNKYDLKHLDNLNWQEKRIIQLFIDNKGKIVDFDAIGQVIFKDENEYSPWAIAKFMQRLREKLEKNGISGSYIQTIRKKGYTLR